MSKPTIVIVAGSRDFDDYELMCRHLDELFDGRDIQIMSGEADGADMLGHRYGDEHGIEVLARPAVWNPNGKYDRGAGRRRNQVMGGEADELIAFHNGTSPGTAHMIEVMKMLRKPRTVINFRTGTVVKYDHPP